MAKLTLGWLERVWFPDFGTPDEGVIAKVDTGADSGALHCVTETIIKDEEGNEVLEFQPFDEQHKLVRTKRFKKIYVRSSNGLKSERHRIKTKIKLADGQNHDIELTLADRTEMTYEVIIGRKFLQGRYLVDVSQENV